MTCGITCVDNLLNRSFYKLGLIIGKHPGYFLIVPVLLSLLCITGYQQIKYEIDPEYLFSPIRGEGKTERNIVEEFFKVNYTHRFNVGRITRPGTLLITYYKIILLQLFVYIFFFFQIIPLINVLIFRVIWIRNRP